MGQGLLETLRFQTTDGAQIEADLYKGGSHAVVLAHGKVFDKESWTDLTATLNTDGLTVLTLNFRGYGTSSGPEAADGYARDLGAAVQTLRDKGASEVSVIGGSMGAIAAAESVIAGFAPDLRTLILMAPRTISLPTELKARHLAFIASRDEDCAGDVEAFHAAAPGPKSLKLFDGDAHAQFLFKGEHATELTDLIRSLLK